MGESLFSISGRRTVITGGASGIGLAIARHFSAEGATVVITDIQGSGAVVAAEAGAGFVQMDVADDESVEKGMQEAAELLGGGIDVLILNAGIDLEVGVAWELDLNNFRKVMDVNFMGVTAGLGFGVRHMDAGGSVIITSSPAGRLTLEGMSAYSASKAAVDSLTHTAAIELGRRDIRVNAVLPGIVKTAMADGATGDGSWLTNLTISGAHRDPEELAPIYHFLASSASAPIIGATIESHDGMTAGLSGLLMDRAFSPEDFA
jgi:3alpha(or 20beta)-hydroxysteroid dehydrogenase